MGKLYELTGQMAALNELADVDDGAMMEAIADTMNGLQAEFKDKAGALIMVHRNMEAEVEVIEAEIARLKARAQTIKNKTEYLRQYLRDNMQAAGIKKIEHDLFTITLKKPAVKVDVLDADAVPDDYVQVKTVISVDKLKALADLKAGENIPGLALVEGQAALLIK